MANYKNGKNTSIFYWLLCNLKSPMIVTVSRLNCGKVTGTPRIIFKVFKRNRTFMFSRIYKKEAHDGKFYLYTR